MSISIRPATAKLIRQTKTYLSKRDVELITNALVFAQKAHAGQSRQTGEPYVIHPLATAQTLADYHLDAITIAAALLHDVCEDTEISLTQVRASFGPDIALLVDGVTKLGQVRLKKGWQASYRGFHTNHQGENFETFDRHVRTLRKMFLAMSRDIRIVLIKLADRLHNMETLSALPSEKQRRIAQETLEVFAPLANRLGIGQLRGQLEDLAFPYAMPEEYQQLHQGLGTTIKKRQRYVERVRRVLLKKLAAIGIRGEGHARIKHLYSLWKKLQRHDQDLGKIYDLVAARVIVPTVEDCYRTLGLVHQMWRPLPGRIKDYIATPKPNGYQSLHTTVFALNGVLTEIQIRTPEMHHWAEYGIAAHWAYKEDGDEDSHHPGGWNPDRSTPAAPSWMRDLARLEKTSPDTGEWRNGLKLDFFQDRIFVFTPHGDVLDLPSRATPIDFAFGVHSELGRHCAGAKINGKLVPLDQTLHNGDIVEIVLNQKKVTPKRDWLQFAKTNRARNQIKKILGITPGLIKPKR